MKNKRFIIILSSIFLLLLIPLVAMQFTNEVSWSILDFIIMGLLLFVAGLTCEFVLRKVAKTKYRFALLMGVLVLFLLVWAELAVGIFNSPFAGS